MINLHVIGGDQMVSRMFQSKGYKIITAPGAAKVVVWTGGADIDPGLYDEIAIPECGSPNYERDDKEAEVYDIVKDPAVLKIGICRGAQFLNVMNGGRLWQHVDNHTRNHPIHIQETKSFKVGSVKLVKSCVSTHHQMMRPGPDHELVGYATEATIKKSYQRDISTNLLLDSEILYYPKTNTFCFQPHPEYEAGDTRELFFALLEQIPQ